MPLGYVGELSAMEQVLVGSTNVAPAPSVPEQNTNCGMSALRPLIAVPVTVLSCRSCRPYTDCVR